MFNSDWYPAFQESDNAFERFGERATFATWCIERIPREEWLAPPQQSREEAERLLALLDPTATGFSFQTLDDDKDRKAGNLARVLNGPLDKYWRKLVNLNNNRVGVYVTINETDGKGRKRENVERVRALFVDLDGAPLTPVMRSEPKPHIVVESSPGRFHVYWLVNDVKLEQFEDLQRALAERFGGDRVVDLPRVLRLPGFFHHKSERFLSRILSVQRHLPLYTAADFDASNRSINVVDFFSAADAINREHASKSETQRLNDLAIKHYAAWVPEIFPNAKRKDNGGYRVSSAKLGRENEEDLSFHPDGIKDFGVHDLDDPREGKRTPIDIVMEYVLNVPIEEIAARSNTVEFEKAQEWLRKRLPKQEEQKPDEPFPFINVGAWHGKPVPPRDWVVETRIPAGPVTGLYGDGGTGKTILLLQLAVAVVLGHDWLGASVPVSGPVLLMCCEDDEDELHRRMHQIAHYYGATFAELAKHLHLASFVGDDAILAAPDRNGLIRPTSLFTRLSDAARDIRPRFIGIDNATDVFAGNEIIRAQVRQFTTLLRGLALTANSTVILTAHPSLTGLSSGTGSSGSTGWNNAFRSRLYLRREKTEKDVEPDPDVRELEVMKANYGPIGETVSLRWQDGVFKPELGLGLGSTERLAADLKVEEHFLQQLDFFIDSGRVVSDKLKANNYAPTLFAESSLPGVVRHSKRDYAQAMERLFGKRKIRVEVYGRTDRDFHKLMRV
jgi:RecA-family ATPase